MTFTLLLIVLQGLASTDNWTCDTTFARLGSYSLRYCSVSGVVVAVKQCDDVSCGEHYLWWSKQ